MPWAEDQTSQEYAARPPLARSVGQWWPVHVGCVILNGRVVCRGLHVSMIDSAVTDLATARPCSAADRPSTCGSRPAQTWLRLGEEVGLCTAALPHATHPPGRRSAIFKLDPARCLSFDVNLCDQDSNSLHIQRHHRLKRPPGTWSTVM